MKDNPPGSPNIYATLLIVEREGFEQIDFDDIINQFVAIKARRINLI